MKTLRLHALAVIMVIILSAGCRPVDTPALPEVIEQTPAATAVEDEFTVTIQEPGEPSPSETAEPADEGKALTDVCPAPVEGSKLYLDEQNGFCLLYPENLEQVTYQEFSFDRVQFHQPITAVSAMEGVNVSLVIESNGPAKELTGSQYARKWLENFSFGPQPDIQDFMLSGEKGSLVNLETEFGPMEQNVFLVANEMKYRIILSPMPGSAPDLEEDLKAVWRSVVGSLVFFEPQSERKHVAPEDVCPQESAGYKQYISLTDGYCLLYPSDFEPSENFPGEFIGGPVLEANTSWGDVRASLTVGTAGQYPDQSIQDVMETRREFIDSSSIQETVMGGCPAVIFRDPRGPWASRQAMILREGFVYTLVNQPWEPVRYPEGMVYLDSIWNTVTSSLAFFEPWR